MRKRGKIHAIYSKRINEFPSFQDFSLGLSWKGVGNELENGERPWRRYRLQHNAVGISISPHNNVRTPTSKIRNNDHVCWLIVFAQILQCLSWK